MIPLNLVLSADDTNRSAIQMDVSTPLINIPLGVVTPFVPFTELTTLLDSHAVWKVPSYRESVALLANATSIIYRVFGLMRWNGRPLLTSRTEHLIRLHWDNLH